MRTKKRGLSLFITLCLIVGMLPQTAFATQGVTIGTSGLCEHHTAHDETCGYVEAAEGTPCTHEHSEDCYEITESCTHTHTEECSPVLDSGVSGNEGTPSDAAQPTCGHECSEESGCITEGLNCTHTHDDLCGYIAAVEGHDCHYECVECIEQSETPTTQVCTCEAAEGEAHAEDCALYEAPTDSTCTCETKCVEDAINHDCTICSTEGADLTACTGEETPAAPVCDCGTDDETIHATTCGVYVAPENPLCYCAEKCTEVNIWCDVCGFDISKCTGAKTAVGYAEGDKVSVTINGETTYYTSIKDAVAKANKSGNATITLLQDTTTRERLDITKSATLDLNGNTLSCTAYFADDYETMVAITTNNTKLTIIDSVGGGKLDGTGTDYALMLGEPGAYTARSASAYIDGSTVSGSVKTVSGTSMTVSGSTVESNSVVATIDMTNETTLNVFNSQILNTHSSSAARAIDNIGTLTITDSTISGSIGVKNGGTANISGNTNITGTERSVVSNTDDEGALTITGGNYTGGIRITGGTATISGGSYTGGIVVTGGTVTISGGTITESRSNKENAVEVSGSAELTISGGTFSAIAGEIYDTGVYVHDGGTVKITGGTITSTAYGVYNEGGSATISGGSISGGTVDLYNDSNNPGVINLTLSEGKTIGATFPGGIIAEGITLAELLATDTAAYWGVVDGKDTMLTVADDTATGITDKGDITIRAICDHSGNTSKPVDAQNGTHSFTCTVCQTAVTEDHTLTDGACTACDYVCPHSSFDSTTGICGDCQASVAVAKVETGGTTTYYLTADELWNAVENNSADQAVTLLADIEILALRFFTEKTTNTLNLNGHTLTGSEPNAVLIVAKGCELTITGSGSILFADNILMTANYEGSRIVVGKDVTLNGFLRSMYGGVLDLSNATIPEAGLNVILYTDDYMPATYNVSDVLLLPADYYFFVNGVAVHSYSENIEGTVKKHTDHSYIYTDNNDGTHKYECSICGDNVTEAHKGGTATCTEKAECKHCGASYGEVDTTNHDSSVAFDSNGFCPNGCYQPAELKDGYYEIKNAGNLYWFAQQVNGGNGAINGKLTTDIVVNQNVLVNGALNSNTKGFRVWTPIGYWNSSEDLSYYVGTFDGAGFTVSGLYLNDSTKSRIGLFGAVSTNGIVKNVGVVDSYFYGNDRVGGVVGYNYTSSTVQNCYNTGTVKGKEYVGGVVGYNYEGTVQNCYNIGTVSSNDTTGGVVSLNWGGLVTNCYNTGTVKGGNETGGVVGKMISASVELCYNTGTVNGKKYVGGIFGYGTSGNARNCYNTGMVSGRNQVGGVVGYIGSGTVENCYNANSISGSSNVGGVVGARYNSNTGITTNSYFDSTKYSGSAIGENDAGATTVEGKTTEQFASGEVAYLLSQGENGGVWGQTIGENGDPYPVLGGTKVYYGYLSCADDAVKVYTNDSTASETKPEHSDNTNSVNDNGDGTHSFTCTVCQTAVTEDHTLTYTANDNVITNGCSKCEYVTGTATISATSATYNGTEQKTANVAYSNGWTGGNLAVSYENNTNAGTATASISVTDGGNEVKASVTFEIAKANASISADPTAKTGLAYTGNPQELITAGTTTGGEMQYSLDDTNYSTTIPAGTAVQEYTVYYKVVGDSNHNDTAAQTITVSISKGTAPAITKPTARGIEYGQPLSASTLSDTNWKWVDGTVVPNSSGNYEAYFTVDDTNYDYSSVTGYNETTHTVTREIQVIVSMTTPAITVQATPASAIAGKTITVSATVKNPHNESLSDLPTPTYTYKIGDSGEETGFTGSFVIPKNTATGTTITITATTTANDKYAAGTGTATVIVTDCTHAGNKTFQHDTASHWYVCGECGAEVDKASHSWGYTANGDTITKSCQAADCPETGVKTIVISASSKEYDGTAVTATVTNHVDNTDYRASIVYEAKTGTLTEGRAVNAGTYTAKITVGGATASVDFTISQIPLTIQAKDQTITYGQSIAAGTDQVAATGLVGGDTLTGVTLTPSISDVGTGVITPTAAEVSSLASNYNITYQTGTLTITQAAAQSLTETLYVANNHAGTYTLDLSGITPTSGSWGGNPAVSFALGAVSLDQNYYDSGADVTNGRLTLPIKTYETATEGSIGTVTVTITSQNFAESTLTVTVMATNKTPVTIEGVTPATGLVYNGTAQQGYTGSPTNAQGYTGGYAFSYADAQGNPLTEAPTDGGSYTVTISVPGSSGTHSGSLTLHFQIAKKQLSWGAGTAVISQAYVPNRLTVVDTSSITPGSIALTGVLAGDDVRWTGTVQSASFADDSIGTGKPVAVALSGLALTGADAHNYLAPTSTLTLTGDITTPNTGNDEVEVLDGFVVTKDANLPNDASYYGDTAGPALDQKFGTTGEGTIHQIEVYMKKAGEDAIAALSGVETGSTKTEVLEISLKYWDGDSWEKIDEEHLDDVLQRYPNGVPVTIPYNLFGFTDTANYSNYKFVVQHMITLPTDDRYAIGDIEDLSGDVTAAADGLHFNVMHGFSPFVVGFAETKTSQGGNTGDNGGNAGTTSGGGTSYGNNNNDSYTAPTYRNHKEDFGDVQASLKHVDLNTGGEPLDVEAPAIVGTITTPDGKPEITDPRRGLADTTEDAKKDIEKDIPGVVEPEVVAPAPDDATESQSKSGGLFAGIALLLAALAVGGGYLYFRKRKEAE